MMIVPINRAVSPEMVRETAPAVTKINSASNDTRAEQRQRLLHARLSLSPEQCAQRDAQMVQELRVCLDAHCAPTACIVLYHPFKNEPDLMALADAWRAQGGKVLLPVVVARNAPLGFARYMGADDLEVGAFGIKQPRVDSDAALVMTPESIDVLVMPCVGFSREGYRLGYGGGYYDRTCAHWLSAGFKLPTLIGVADGLAQIELDAQAHDVRMDFVCAV